MIAKRPAALVLDIGEVLLRLDFSPLFRELKFEKGADVAAAVDALGRWELFDAFERGHFPEDEFRRRLEKSLGRKFEAAPFRTLWNSVIVGPVPGIEALLATVGAQVPLFALTNSNEIHVRYLRERFPWLPARMRIFSSHELGLRKPEREIFEKTAAAIGEPCERLLFVDDREENVTGARAAGFQAEHCRDSAAELPAILTRHGFRTK